MKGHQHLVAMRQAGLKPECVWLTDADCGMWRDWQRFGVNPWVLIEPADNLQRLDLRVLVGLLVFVDCDDAERMKAIVEACARAKATRVIGLGGEPSKPVEFVMADSEGEMLWPV